MLESYAAEVVFHAEQAELHQRLRRMRSAADRREAVEQNQVAPVFARTRVRRRARGGVQAWPRPIGLRVALVAPDAVPAC
jgi:hypothetical protein